jgi:hypothetical protein
MSDYMHKNGTCEGCVADPYVQMEHQLKDKILALRAEADALAASLDELHELPNNKERLKELHEQM